MLELYTAAVYQNLKEGTFYPKGGQLNRGTTDTMTP